MVVNVYKRAVTNPGGTPERSLQLEAREVCVPDDTLVSDEEPWQIISDEETDPEMPELIRKEQEVARISPLAATSSSSSTGLSPVGIYCPDCGAYFNGPSHFYDHQKTRKHKKKVERNARLKLAGTGPPLVSGPVESPKQFQ